MDTWSASYVNVPGLGNCLINGRWPASERFFVALSYRTQTWMVIDRTGRRAARPVTSHPYGEPGSGERAWRTGRDRCCEWAMRIARIANENEHLFTAYMEFPPGTRVRFRPDPADPTIGVVQPNQPERTTPLAFGPVLVQWEDGLLDGITPGELERAPAADALA